MAHVKRVERSNCGRCGVLIKVARWRYAMWTLYQVRARNELKHHHERGKMNPVIEKMLKTEGGQSGTQTETAIGVEKMVKK